MFFDLGSRKIPCYCWHQYREKRGSSEVGLCIFKNLQNVDDGKEIELVSDAYRRHSHSVKTVFLLLYCRILGNPIID
jgi:hypothetical protein